MRAGVLCPRLMQQLGKNPQAASPTAPCFETALCTPVG
jgi:hypothetical protein